MNKHLKSSVGKKQVVAATGLMLILFIVGHLAGNMTFYFGPDTFNAYAEKLMHLRPGLYIVEGGLLVIFLIHMWFTALVVHENMRSRPIDYEVKKSSKKRSLATKLMPYTGTMILAFVIWHLIDFTFSDKHGQASVLGAGDVSFELYGVVYNAFKNPIHSALYVVAMWAVAMHLSHGIQSFTQSFGIKNQENSALIDNISNYLALVVGLLFSSIPLYVLLIAPIY